MRVKGLDDYSYAYALIAAWVECREVRHSTHSCQSRREQVDQCLLRKMEKMEMTFLTMGLFARDRIELVFSNTLCIKKMRNIVAETMLTCLRGAMVAHQTSNLGVAGSIPAVSVLQKMFFEDFNF